MSTATPTTRAASLPSPTRAPASRRRRAWRTISQSGNVAVTNAGDLIAQADGGAGSVATGVRMDRSAPTACSTPAASWRPAPTRRTLQSGRATRQRPRSTTRACWRAACARACSTTASPTARMPPGTPTASRTSCGRRHRLQQRHAADAGRDDHAPRRRAAGNAVREHWPAAGRRRQPHRHGRWHAFAFTNDGMIDFRDGAPDDILHIGGDLAGSGHLQVDMSGLHGPATSWMSRATSPPAACTRSTSTSWTCRPRRRATSPSRRRRHLHRGRLRTRSPALTAPATSSRSPSARAWSARSTLRARTCCRWIST